MFAAARFDYHRLRDPIIFRSLVAFSALLLLLVLLSRFGIQAAGAQRWLAVGPYQFQPAEFAKFALILLLAVKMTTHHEQIHRFSTGFMPPMLIAMLFSALVLAERDLGIPIVMMGVAYIMLFVAGARWRHLIASLVPVLAAVLILILWVPHRRQRLMIFRNPWEDRYDSGFQLIQSMAAFAQGGIHGRGAGASEQKLGYLYAAHTDFIFAVIGEELGLIGTLAVTALFLVLLIGACRVAMNAQDLFGTLLATGITAAITLQAAFIMAVTTGLLPTKGLPLPFIAYGGTALIVFLGMAGVLVNISVQAIQPERQRRTAAAG